MDDAGGGGGGGMVDDAAPPAAAACCWMFGLGGRAGMMGMSGGDPVEVVGPRVLGPPPAAARAKAAAADVGDSKGGRGA